MANPNPNCKNGLSDLWMTKFFVIEIQTRLMTENEKSSSGMYDKKDIC